MNAKLNLCNAIPHAARRMMAKGYKEFRKVPQIQCFDDFVPAFNKEISVLYKKNPDKALNVTQQVLNVLDDFADDILGLKAGATKNFVENFCKNVSTSLLDIKTGITQKLGQTTHLTDDLGKSLITDIESGRFDPSCSLIYADLALPKFNKLLQHLTPAQQEKALKYEKKLVSIFRNLHNEVRKAPILQDKGSNIFLAPIRFFLG